MPFSNEVYSAGVNNRGDMFEEGLLEGGTATVPEVPEVPEVMGTPEIDLATAETYGVLAGSTVTNTGPTTIDGDLGLDPGSALVGAPTVTGATNINNPAAIQAKTDLTAAYVDAQGRTSDFAVVANLAGQTLPPGVYTAATSMDLSVGGTLTLDGGGDPNAFWIFQMGTSLTINTGASVVMINVGSSNSFNVWWAVGSSATIGSGALMEGTIMADQSITLVTGATLNGRALAQVAAVTLDTNTVTVQDTPVITPAVPAVPAVVTTTVATITPGTGTGFPSDQSILTKIEQVDIVPTDGDMDIVSIARNANLNAVIVTFTGAGEATYHFEGFAA